MSTKIEWCDETVNPQGWGCWGPEGTPEKPAICPGCYAYEWARKGRRDCPDCTAFRPHWHHEQLEKPLHWKKHRAIFWQDMGDLWHPETPMHQIDTVLAICKSTPQHTHLFLTKNPEGYIDFWHDDHNDWLPSENAFYGVTVRNQEEADRLVPVLLKLAAMGFKVFISYEPAWGPVDFRGHGCAYACSNKRDGKCTVGGKNCDGLHYKNIFINGIIAGGMTGKDARPAHPDWFRSVRDQCATAGVPFFFKGWGEWVDQTTLHFSETKYKGDRTFYRIGKKVSGRLLDGRTHDELPWKVNKLEQIKQEENKCPQS